MAFREGSHHEACWLVLFAIVREALDMRQLRQVLVQFERERAGMAKGFQVICHAGDAIHDAYFLGGLIRTGCLVDHMPDLWETCWLEAVAGHRRESCLEYEPMPVRLSQQCF